MVVDNWVGKGFELNSIVAAVIGGVALSGGRGTLPGALAGAAILVAVFNAVLLFGLPRRSSRSSSRGWRIIVAAAAARQSARGDIGNPSIPRSIGMSSDLDGRPIIVTGAGAASAPPSRPTSRPRVPGSPSPTSIVPLPKPCAAVIRRQSGEAKAFEVDVAQRESVRGLVAGVAEAFRAARRDVRTIAGISKTCFPNFMDTTEADFQRIMRVNGLGVTPDRAPRRPPAR